MEGGNFCSTPLQSACLTQPSVSFASLHDSIDSVSNSFHQSPFTTSSIQNDQNQDKTRGDNTIIFSENVLPIRLYNVSGVHRNNDLTKHAREEGDKLTELCQASDLEDEPVSKSVHVLTDGMESSSNGNLHLSSGSALKIRENYDVDSNTTERKETNVDPSDASDLLQEIQENNKKRMHGIFAPPMDVPPFQVDEASMIEIEKLSQEKNTLFSENLGLIAKDSKEFRSLTKFKPTQKGVRTRKSIWSPSTPEEAIKGTESGHKHTKCTHKCGCCSRTFKEICKLHDHLIGHGNGGSYHYDHILKTAFPKFDSACAFTQTSSEDQNIPDTIPNKKQTIKPLRNVVKTKAKTLTEKKKAKKVVLNEKTTNQPASAARNRKPRKDKTEKVESEKHNKKKPIAKFKVKTDDGGNTWKGVEMISKPRKEIVENGESGEGLKIPVYIDLDMQTENEDRVEKKSMFENKGLPDVNPLVDKHTMPEVKKNSAEQNIEKNVSRKRKMSTPRKLTPIVGPPVTNTIGKILNSRVKPEKKIKCDFCPGQFQYTRGLIRHEQEKHADKLKFECEICHIKFMREYNKERHVLCTHTTGKAKALKERKAAVKVTKKPGRKPREKMSEERKACGECGKVLPESKAVIHARIHTGDRPFICHICGKGLISDKKLKRHLLIHSDVNRHTCEVCGTGFSMKYKLRTHMYIHTGHKPYLCSVCGAEFNNSTSLLHHHRTVHLGDKRFECKICGGKYGKKSQLDEHMYSHSNERTQTCRYCGKTFKHGKSLRRHESTHVTNEKFQCDQCDSKFSRKDNLERHKMCHFEITLQCKFCKKKFRDKKPLSDHEQFHINQKKLQCHVCKEKFQDETYFYNHMEKQHEITRDMLTMVDITPNSKDENGNGIAVNQDHNLIISSLKLAISGNGAVPGIQSVLSSSHQDTLNLSMNAAGIIPTSNHDILVNPTQSNIQSILVAPNTGQQAFNHSQTTIGLNVNSSRILNQPMNPSFVTGAHLIPGLHDGQRTIVNVINADNNNSMRLPLDQSTSESMMIHEQQRLMQEALGSTLNMQNSGYRLQNLY